MSRRISNARLRSEGGNRKVVGSELGGGAMAGIGLPSPEFIARATPGTIGDGTCTGSKREAWRTHLAGLERRKSVKKGVRLPKVAADLLCTVAKIEGRELGDCESTTRTLQ
jgi:hypothetical protein